MQDSLRRQDGAAANDCEPVFVVGMNGSGTSMMLDSLGRHPGLYAVPDETLMMPYIISRAHRFGDFAEDKRFLSFWQFALEQMPVLHRVSGGRVPDIPASWSLQPRTIAGVFDGIFSDFAAREGKRRWCEKTPDHVQHLELLSEIFEKARFVHMIRDGREVACSLARRHLKHPELVIYRWKKAVQTGRSDGAALGDRYLEVIYEELTRDPEGQMRRLCDFLRLEFDERVLQSQMPQSLARKQLADGALGRISPNPLKWRGHFDGETLRELESIGGRMLEGLGYDVENLAGDRDPGWLIRHYWRAIDFLRITNHRRRTSKKYDSWRKVIRNAFFSFKEYRTKRH
jgi:hypothetical protein